MKLIEGEQLSLIAEDDYDYCTDRQYDRQDLRKIELAWEYLDAPEKLGTNQSLVPNSPLPELGTNNSLVPNFSLDLPLGCLQQKWIKDHQYWYWRYYDRRGKKVSRYLGKDYNKAISKAINIGVPTDARLPKTSTKAALKAT